MNNYGARNQGLNSDRYSQPPDSKGQDTPSYIADLQLLFQSLEIIPPTHIEPNTTEEIIINFKNTGNKDIRKVVIDMKNVEEFFNVGGNVEIESLPPGMDLQKRINISPKYSKGTFPVDIILSGNGIKILRKYTIKVGGTEIY